MPACVTVLASWAWKRTSVNMFPQSQSSQMPAFIRNYTSEIPWFLTLLLVHDLHSLFASLKAILIKRTALIYDISGREYKHFESLRTENWTKIMHTKQKVWSKGPRDTQIIVCTTERNKFRLSRGLSFSLPFWTEACVLKSDHQIFYGNANSIFPESLLALSRWPKSQKTVSTRLAKFANEIHHLNRFFEKVDS